MIPPPFDYFAPTDIQEALDLLNKYGEEAKILAGGQSLVPLLKARITTIPYLISLSEIRGLSYIDERKGALHIGAMTLDCDIELSGIIKKRFPILADAAGQLADPLVRNMGTIGGNISHADPSNDLPAVMNAIGATMIAKGRKGSREINASDFFIDTFTTALDHGEILTEIRLPFWGNSSGGSYVKFKKGTWNFSVAAVAVQLELDGKKVIRSGIATTSVGPRTLKMEKAEKFIIGKELTEDTIKQAAEMVARDSQPASDSYGSEEYKREILRRITTDAIKNAHKRAGGE